MTCPSTPEWERNKSATQLITCYKISLDNEIHLDGDNATSPQYTTVIQHQTTEGGGGSS
jgi:hypothetical protein